MTQSLCRLFAFMCLALSACGASLAKPPARELRPELRALVDQLARFKGYESSHIGAAGAPSPVWAAWAEVQKAATTAELNSLLGHASPVVRAYAARHFAMSETPLDTSWVEPMLGDNASLGATEGCMRFETTVAELLIDTLRWSAADKAGAKQLLERINRAER